MVVMGEKRKVVVFNLEKPVQRQIYEFAQTIDFGKEVKQFLSLRMRGISLQAMATAAQRVASNRTKNPPFNGG